MRSRFKWNRKTYKMASHLARLINRFDHLPSQQPEILRRYFELWDRHPQREDFLLTPVKQRLGWKSGILF